jgi:hypothetical protein
MLVIKNQQNWNNMLQLNENELELMILLNYLEFQVQNIFGLFWI